MMLLWRIAIVGAVLPGTLRAAGEADSSGIRGATGRLVIQSTPESALVMIDRRPAGLTPLTIDSIGPGEHLVMIQPPDVESWLTEPISDTVHMGGGEHKVLRYALRARHFIASDPFGADVIVGDSVVGTTPFIAGSMLEGQSITLRKAGYEPATMQLSPAQSTLEIPLRRVWHNDGEVESYFKDADNRGSGSTWRILSATATVAFGTTAAYLKIKADNRYQQFLDTNDGRLLTETHHLDTAAGLAIAATQISLGLFTYFIFSK